MGVQKPSFRLLRHTLKKSALLRSRPEALLLVNIAQV